MKFNKITLTLLLHFASQDIGGKGESMFDVTKLK